MNRFHTLSLSLPGLFLLVLIHVAAGAFMGRLFPAGEWGQGLVKPAIYPPGWMFPVVWTILYALLGGAVWCLLRDAAQNSSSVRRAVLLHGAQYTVNLSFTPLCFGLESTGLGFLVCAGLFPLAVFAARAFAQISKRAGWLLVPYLIWLAFALLLSGSLWSLNSF